MTEGEESYPHYHGGGIMSVEQRHKDWAARALDKTMHSNPTWEALTAHYVGPDRLWQARHVAKTFATFEASLPLSQRVKELEAERDALRVANALVSKRYTDLWNESGARERAAEDQVRQMRVGLERIAKCDEGMANVVIARTILAALPKNGGEG